MKSLDYLKTGNDTVWSTFLLSQCEGLKQHASRAIMFS